MEASGGLAYSSRTPMRKTKSMPSRSFRSSNDDQVKDTDYMRNLPLYKAVDNGEWEAMKKFLEDHPEALTASLSADGDTALHVAVLAGHVEIVEELVSRLSGEELVTRNKSDATALNYAAIGGILRIAEALVNKHKEPLTIANQNGQIPVVVASLYGHKDLARYLYRETPKHELSPERGKNGAMLLTICVIDELFDIALDLLQRYPKLAFDQDSDNDTALKMLAQKPSSFFTGSSLAFWQCWIYKSIRVPQLINVHGNVNGDIERPHTETAKREPAIRRGIHQVLIILWKGLKVLVPGVKEIYNMKVMHSQAHELLCCICEQMSTLHKSEFDKLGVYSAVFKAVQHGIVEFIIEIMRHHPDIVWCEDELNRGIFLYATSQRQEKIFSLIYKMGAKKNSMATSWDKYHNNILHQAALLAPSSRLDLVSGAALQMQRELQWYKEVESIVQPKYREMRNVRDKTPQALFTDSHRELKAEGEKWLKDTADSCTVVAALIATIMFAAAFTVPGGYNQESGKPIYLYRNSFMVFIISDALSLFASSSSLLMFLGILTSRYREEDFLKSLPTKLIIGLSSLFFSIAVMMVTFGASIVIMIQTRIKWVAIPIIMLGSVPVTLFALLQFPLLVEIFFSTYGPGIFYKPKKPLGFF